MSSSTAKQQNIFSRTIAFFAEVWKEFKAVIWPTPQTVATQFVVVLVVSSSLIVLLYLMDIAFNALIFGAR